MHAVIRSYTGASQLISEMTKRDKDVEELLKSVPGFVAYHAVEADDRLTTITVCENATGTAESTQRASRWVKENLPGISMSPPHISEGDVFIHFAR